MKVYIVINVYAEGRIDSVFADELVAIAKCARLNAETRAKHHSSWVDEWEVQEYTVMEVPR